jgi:signal transduction histidine kinase
MFYYQGGIGSPRFFWRFCLLSSSYSIINRPKILREQVILATDKFRNAQVEAENAKEQLRQAQKMEAVGQLTGGVAHDFNNLLAIMMGNAELLVDSVGDDEDAKHSTKAIKAAVVRGASLTGRLLAFSRQTMLSPVSAGVTSLIGDLEDMLRRSLGETIDLKIEENADLWHATIDLHQFENALINLALNARDAMPNGGTLTIETANVTLDEDYVEQNEEVTPGDYVEVSVSDTGTGIPPEVLEKVFEPFFTTKEVGEGSGLGLSMVFGFAKQSKGHITITSPKISLLWSARRLTRSAGCQRSQVGGGVAGIAPGE